MKLSDFNKSDFSETEIAWGIEVDCDMIDAPVGLKVAGLLWKGEGPTDLDESLIDTIIAFNLSGVEVILEVRPGDIIDHKHLLTVAGNAGFSVAAIPPENEADLDAWCAQCAGFAEALLTVPNFSRSLIPVTGYLTYLTLETFAGADRAVPTDPYVSQRFMTAAPIAWSDRAKAEMRQRMCAVLGGEEKLQNYLGAILRSLYEETEKHRTDTARIQTNG